MCRFMETRLIIVNYSDTEVTIDDMNFDVENSWQSDNFIIVQEHEESMTSDESNESSDIESDYNEEDDLVENEEQNMRILHIPAHTSSNSFYGDDDDKYFVDTISYHSRRGEHDFFLDDSEFPPTPLTNTEEFPSDEQLQFCIDKGYEFEFPLFRRPNVIFR